MILIILMMVLVIGDNVVDLANTNFATVHSIQSFDLLVKQNLVKDRLSRYLKPRQFSTDIIATLKIWSMLLVRSPSISPFCFLVSALKMKRKEFLFLLSVLYHDDNLENTIVVGDG